MMSRPVCCVWCNRDKLTRRQSLMLQWDWMGYDFRGYLQAAADHDRGHHD